MFREFAGTLSLYFHKSGESLQNPLWFETLSWNIPFFCIQPRLPTLVSNSVFAGWVMFANRSCPFWILVVTDETPASAGPDPWQSFQVLPEQK